jgi:hypothetical protein
VLVQGREFREGEWQAEQQAGLDGGAIDGACYIVIHDRFPQMEFLSLKEAP